MRLTLSIVALVTALFSSAVRCELLCINYTRHVSATWYVNGSTAQLDAFPTGGGDDIECQADGAELAYITRNFTGIRGMRGETQVLWAGEDAVFIIDNL
jgi:hypothetical protein